MSGQPSRAFAIASLLLLPTLGACTPVPSASGDGKQATAGAKPEDTCAHVRELASKDSSDAAVLDQVERECVEALAGLQNRYETFSTCVTLAADRAAVVECEKSLAPPRSLLAAVGPGAQVEALCDHVFTMLTAQLTQSGAEMSPAELEQLRTQCIEGATAQLELKGAEVFAKEAECIMRAQTVEELQACGV